MSEPPPGAVPPDPQSNLVPPGPGEAPASAENAGGVFMPGQRWRHFMIVKPAESGVAGAFEGLEAGAMEAVLLLNRPVTEATEWRRQAWARLQQMESDRLVSCVEAHEENGRRVEVYASSSLPTLRTWVAKKQPTADALKEVVRQVALLLRALHTEGLVHLALSPDTVHVESGGAELKVVLGGLHAATPFEQPGLIPVDVNPFIAPPEAAGLYQMSPGRELCGWDWWTLGRSVQECLLGASVYARQLGCDARQPGPEHRARAAHWLLERDPSGPRAGAVEAMPEDTDPGLRALLRGLLASARDGRWRDDEVMRWHLGESVRDHYDLPREARFFFWRDRAVTLPEAAELFGDASVWAEGESVLFAAADEPTGLRYFLAQSPAHKAESDLVEELLTMEQAQVWEALPVEARRTAIAALAWVALSSASGRETAAVVRGHRIDAAGLGDLLRDEIPADAVALVHAMTTEPYVQRLESLGAVSAARVLRQLADTAGRAIREAISHHWGDASDSGMQARLCALALESDQELAARLERLRIGYAANRDPAITALMQATRPERWALTLLGFMGGFAADYGFITHAEWNQQRHLQLRQRAGALAAAVFWHRLRRVMVALPTLFGTWPMYALVWGIPLLLAGAAHAWGNFVLIAVLAAGFRAGAQRLLNGAIRRAVPTGAPWGPADRPQRCAREAAACLPAGFEDTSCRGILRELRAVVAEAAALPLATRTAAMPRPVSLAGLWSLSGAALAVVVALAAWQLHPLLFPVADDAAAVAQAAAAHAKVLAALKAGPTAVPGVLYEEVNDGFGRRMRGPLKPWDVPPPKVAAALPVVREEAMSPDQAAFALVAGQLLLDPYPRKGLNLILAIRVPADNEVGLVLMDTRERRLAGSAVYLVDEAPNPRTWYQIGTVRVVYLGEPPTLATPRPRAGPF